MNLNSYFSVPIAQKRIQNSDRLNHELRSLLLMWEKNEPPRISAPTPVAKYQVYESDFALFNRTTSPIPEIANICLSNLGELVMRINNYTAEEMRKLRIYHHSWYHITRTGGYTGFHNHPMACWSGVYCVTPGDNPSGHKENGTLKIFDPRQNSNMYVDPGNAKMRSEFAFGTLPVNFSAGDLVLFPSYLYHEVAPFWGNDVRITIAFNAWIRAAGEEVDEPGIDFSR